MQNGTHIGTDVADLQANNRLKAAAASNEDKHDRVDIDLHDYFYLVDWNEFFLFFSDLR